ncbi:MAG TPA: type II toxin-antitoxin system VapC family toxin [Patescibacteria group bacterium]|nr:type II toxin-antitoxin system VapC family toxin [Patescibacteria group bacterium]
MKKQVLDASIIMTALINEEKKVSHFLEELLHSLQEKKIEIYSTPFMQYEVANGLRFSFTDEQKSIEIFNKLSEIPIKIFFLNALQLKETIILSYQLKTTVYDTAYHYIAQLIDGLFITCDRAYYQKAKHLKHIMLI